jgi:arginase
VGISRSPKDSQGEILAVKIVRQVKSIALLGAPTSAAGLAGGQEGAPAALRAAGLTDRLSSAGFQITDYGDCAPRLYKADDEHPRARNVGEVLAILEELRPKVEIAVKSGALPVILGGDDSVVLAAIAGARRYYRNVSLISMDRDAGLNVPATTPSGCIDGMVISHVIGRGAPELVRFWGEPPLVREPDVAVFGIDRVDEPEQRSLVRSPLHRYLAVDLKNRGLAAGAQEALDTMHGSRHEFVLLLDLDVIASEDFAATNFPGTGGLNLEEVRQALSVFARQPTLGALVIAGYNPARDTDSKAAKTIVDLLANVLSPRLEAPPETAAPSAATNIEGVAASAGAAIPPVAPAEANETPAEAISASENPAPEPTDSGGASTETAPEKPPSDVVPESEPPAE